MAGQLNPQQFSNPYDFDVDDDVRAYAKDAAGGMGWVSGRVAKIDSTRVHLHDEEGDISSLRHDDVLHMERR